ncbi:hypothetical protein BV22DRAFT_1128601 [Leucogyrophana mollusca]|uniref:Uncharacterized protein n=1 Tax=Leucogyrophana mollusca TaxID=85980 RepID=A0ACB8BK96_9AGAM|nr:hypothetical protein BV22DRAFT_1128601 [Leucogyrophana mollusca]
MDGFQFIIESPQETQGHKKRPRLVTSCDNCRLKKIKCLQPTPETQCEACKAAKVPCKFRDRERYFAERSRAIAGPSAAGPSNKQSPERASGMVSQEPLSRSSSVAPPPSSYSSPQAFQQPMNRSSSYSPPTTGYDSQSYARNQSYPPEHARATGTHHRSFYLLSEVYLRDCSLVSARHTPSGSSIYEEQVPYHSGSSGPTQTYQRHHASSSQSSQIFDPTLPQSPHRSLMPHFIQLFFHHMGRQCPFISYEDIQSKFHHQTLTPLLSASIASVSARFSDAPDLVAKGLHNVAEAYSDSAKSLLATLLHQHPPALDTLHAAMILAWAEYKSGRVLGFRQYSELAMRMALAMGLSDQATSQMSHYDQYETRLRSTWSSVTQLQVYATSAVTA